jgi:hypothetical protein
MWLIFISATMNLSPMLLLKQPAKGMGTSLSSVFLFQLERKG